ncbi:hypothetical protein IJI94_00350 [Candidatus Saccharibacteria bacterium]|nr:hypothetical protein [Candidatus Saccharibacteria bacterium]
MDNLNQPSEKSVSKKHKVLRTIRILIPTLFVIAISLNYFLWSHRSTYVLIVSLIPAIAVTIAIVGISNVVINENKDKDRSRNNRKGLRILRALTPIITLYLYIHVAAVLTALLPCTGICIGTFYLIFAGLLISIGICIIIMIILTNKINKA